MSSFVQLSILHNHEPPHLYKYLNKPFCQLLGLDKSIVLSFTIINVKVPVSSYMLVLRYISTALELGRDPVGEAGMRVGSSLWTDPSEGSGVNSFLASCMSGERGATASISTMLSAILLPGGLRALSNCRSPSG